MSKLPDSNPKRADSKATYHHYHRASIHTRTEGIASDQTLLLRVPGIVDMPRRTPFFAEASICVMDQNSIPVMRKLMSLNYALLYSKFALRENVLCMRFSSHTIDASPNKLYDALRELSKKADQLLRSMN